MEVGDKVIIIAEPDSLINIGVDFFITGYEGEIMELHDVFFYSLIVKVIINGYSIYYSMMDKHVSKINK